MESVDVEDPKSNVGLKDPKENKGGEDPEENKGMRRSAYSSNHFGRKRRMKPPMDSYVFRTDSSHPRWEYNSDDDDGSESCKEMTTSKFEAKPLNGRPRAEPGSYEHKLKWDNGLDYSLAMGFYVLTSMSTLIEFPYLFLNYGGPLFALMFAIFLVIFGAPLFYMEMYLGQKTGRVATAAWGSVFVSFGIVQLILCFLQGQFALELTSYALIYLIKSWSGVQPWRECVHGWNTKQCRDPSHRDPPYKTENYQNYFPRQSTADEFWTHQVYDGADGFFHLTLLFGLPILALVILALFKNIRSFVNVLYLFPVVMILIFGALLWRSVTVLNAEVGLKLLFAFKGASVLKDYNLYLHSAKLSLVTLGVCNGVSTTLSSFTRSNKLIATLTFVMPLLAFLSCIAVTTMFLGFGGFYASLTNTHPRSAISPGLKPLFAEMTLAIAYIDKSLIWYQVYFVYLSLVLFYVLLCVTFTIESCLHFHVTHSTLVRKCRPLCRLFSSCYSHTAINLAIGLSYCALNCLVFSKYPIKHFLMYVRNLLVIIFALAQPLIVCYLNGCNGMFRRASNIWNVPLMTLPFLVLVLIGYICAHMDWQEYHEESSAAVITCAVVMLLAGLSVLTRFCSEKREASWNVSNDVPNSKEDNDDDGDDDESLSLDDDKVTGDLKRPRDAVKMMEM